jgi:hypothetical protein
MQRKEKDTELFTKDILNLDAASNNPHVIGVTV